MPAGWAGWALTTRWVKADTANQAATICVSIALIRKLRLSDSKGGMSLGLALGAGSSVGVSKPWGC